MSTQRRSIHILMLAVISYVATSTMLAQVGSSPAVSGQPVARDQRREPSFAERSPRYHVINGDVLELTFEFSPEFNQQVTVQPDGYISLREIGDLLVSGETIPQLTNTLQTAYSKILYQPAISVVLKDFEKPYFVAGGQVAHPGKYDLRGVTTLMQAITMAGGFTDKSKHSEVLLFRRASDQWTEARAFNLKKMLGAKSLAEDPQLEPGDMLFVPQNVISKLARFIPNSSVGYYFTKF